MATADASPEIKRFQSALRIATFFPAEAEGTSPAARAARNEAERRLSLFQDFLVNAFPKFHRVCERIVLNPYAVAYRWPGTQEAAGAPIERVLFLAHYDVVPADKEAWSFDPFSGEVSDGYIRGRGSLDTKNSLLAALEAAEAAIEAGFTPKRELWFAFGGDEERTGRNGAQALAAYFTERNLRFSFLVDEGSAVVDGVLSGIRSPLALIGVAEKGYLDIELRVDMQPGHSSRPPKTQAVAVLGTALYRLSRHPFPWRLTPVVQAFFRGLSTHAPTALAFILRNARALGPLFFLAAGGSPETAAMLRTTVAMTQLQGSDADNVLPSRVSAILNLRLIPGCSINDAIGFVRRAINDPRVQVLASAARDANEPIEAHPAAIDRCAPGWDELVAAVSAAFPSVPIIPYVVTATTDSRHYRSLCPSILRFSPLRLTPSELARIHGIDERISIENYRAGIRFYRTLIESV